jgi:hypothetical protein
MAIRTNNGSDDVDVLEKARTVEQVLWGVSQLERSLMTTRLVPE